jgi:uncharacterized protein (TIGR02996 family)
MRSFEFKDGKSNKFWNIELQGKEFTVTFGKIGTPGQEQTKSFPDAAKAKAAHDKLVAEKLGKGYVETTGKVAVGPSPLQKSLEQALVDNPDDLAAHSAYADYLSEQGDPRGEFIQVQLALEDPKRSKEERKQLQDREKALLKAHGKQWLGFLASHLQSNYRFARGWLDSLEFEALTLDCAKVLANASEARLLRRLVIHNTALVYDEENEEEDYESGDKPLEALARSANLGNIRVFSLGQPSDPEQVPTYGTADMVFRYDAVALIKKMPRLEELYLGAHGVNIKNLFALKALTRLRVMQVDHIEQIYPLDVLARNSSLAQLTDLLLCPHGFSGLDSGEDSYLPFSQVQKLLRSPNFPNLRHLRLRLSDMGDAGCEEIVRSGILKRLKVLELAEGRISDRGAGVLADCPDLKNLQRLDVRYNWLTKKGIAALKAHVPEVQADSQFPEGNEETLYGGDME